MTPLYKIYQLITNSITLSKDIQHFEKTNCYKLIQDKFLQYSNISTIYNIIIKNVKLPIKLLYVTLYYVQFGVTDGFLPSADSINQTVPGQYTAKNVIQLSAKISAYIISLYTY